MKETKQEYLQKVIESHRMTHVSDLLAKYNSKRDEVKEAIEKKYSINIYSPINSGSFAKHTAVNCKFDLDIAVPFKRNAFNTLEEMNNHIFNYLFDTYRNKANVRQQKVSIGIEFFPDKDGDVINLDIVPGRELNQDQFTTDKNMNLYVSSKFGLIAEKTYIQTNIQAQIDHIRDTGDKSNSVRQIIRLLKIWKKYNNQKYKSFLFELITIKAFSNVEVTGNLWEQLKIVLEYIRDNVSKDSFKLTDPGNSNNDVITTLDNSERIILSNKIGTITSNINNNDDNIKIYFPINSNFGDDDSDQGGYGVKGTTPAHSIPPTNQRFG